MRWPICTKDKCVSPSHKMHAFVCGLCVRGEHLTMSHTCGRVEVAKRETMYNLYEYRRTESSAQCIHGARFRLRNLCGIRLLLALISDDPLGTYMSSSWHSLHIHMFTRHIISNGNQGNRIWINSTLKLNFAFLISVLQLHNANERFYHHLRCEENRVAFNFVSISHTCKYAIAQFSAVQHEQQQSHYPTVKIKLMHFSCYFKIVIRVESNQTDIRRRHIWNFSHLSELIFHPKRSRYVMHSRLLCNVHSRA